VCSSKRGEDAELVAFRVGEDRPRDVALAYVGGRIWRYELEPVDGGTLVRESWDISQESRITKPVVRMGAASTRKHMAATLERIEELVTT